MWPVPTVRDKGLSATLLRRSSSGAHKVSAMGGGGGGQEKKGTLSPGSTPFSEHHGFAARGTLVMIFLVFPQIPQLCYLLLTETPLLPQGQPGPRLRTLLPHWPHPRPLLQLLVPQAPSQLLSALHLPQHPPARPCPHSRLWVHHPKPPHESTEACRPPGKQSPPHPVPRSPQVSPSLPSLTLGPRPQPPLLKGLNQRLPLLPCIW